MLVRDIWRFRSLLWDLVVQDFRARYAGSVIGVFWNILQPLAQIFIYAVILARVVGSRIPGREGFPNVDDPYALSIYICAGLLPWLTLSETLTRNSLAFLSHSNLIKKVSFPHPILVLYQVISGLITLFIMHALLIIVMIVTGHRIPLSIVWLPVLYVPHSDKTSQPNQTIGEKDEKSCPVLSAFDRFGPGRLRQRFHRSPGLLQRHVLRGKRPDERLSGIQKRPLFPAHLSSLDRREPRSQLQGNFG